MVWFVIAWLVLRMDVTSLATVGVLVGIALVINAVNEAALAALMAGGWKAAHLVLAVVFVLGAAWAFVRPINTFFALASVLGLILLLQGAFSITRGIALRGVSRHHPDHACPVARDEYYHDDAAPRANSMTPTAFAAVRDDRGRVLLVRRDDSGNWELPGGRVEIGETAAAAAEREVVEESGVSIKVTRLVGIYTDPGHVMVYPATGEARQQFAVCFHALPVDGQPHPDHDETCEAAWIDPTRLDELPIHPSMRLRIAQALNEPDTPHIG